MDTDSFNNFIFYYEEFMKTQKGRASKRNLSKLGETETWVASNGVPWITYARVGVSGSFWKTRYEILRRQVIIRNIIILVLIVLVIMWR